NTTGATPLTAALAVNAPNTLPTWTDATTPPAVSDVCVAGVMVAAVAGASVHVTLAPFSGKPSELRTVKPMLMVPPVNMESLSPKMPVIEPAAGPVESPPPHAPTVPRATVRATTGINRPSSFIVPPLFGHDAVEYLAVSDHPELFPRHTLLHRGVRLEVMRQLGQ